MQMRNLDEIALSYQTDKSSMHHYYTKLYSMYFEKIRGEKLNILEIGIDKGYSLKTWKEYLHNSTITGVDIVDLKHMKEERVNIVQGDQKDTVVLKKINDEFGPFDIIIDDGSHKNDDMQASFDCLFPLLKEGGLYIVEDLHACYWGATHDTGKPIFIDTLKRLIDDVNSGGKSSVANIQRDQDDGWYSGRPLSEMNWWEKNVEFIHLYRSIVFIKKYPSLSGKYTSIFQNTNYLTTGMIQPIKYEKSFFMRIGIRTFRTLRRFVRQLRKQSA